MTKTETLEILRFEEKRYIAIAKAAPKGEAADYLKRAKAMSIAAAALEERSFHGRS